MVDGEKLECDRDVLSSSHFLCRARFKVMHISDEIQKEIISPNCVKCAQFGEKMS